MSATLQTMAHASKLAIELRNISKSFGPVHANRDIRLKVEAGTIHGIVGENGAGKSTLMNLLYGLHRPDSGEMRVNDRTVHMSSAADAIENGIGMVHQHFMLVPNFSVLENVMLGTEGSLLLDSGRARTEALLVEFAERYGMHLNPEAETGLLPVGLQQRVEIVKALKSGARILILDEPTGVLTPQEADSLFEILRTLRDDGVTVLLITHKLDEIMAITDNVSIMRHGQMVGHRRTTETSPEELAELMVGRKVLLEVDRGESNPGDVLLEVTSLSCDAVSGERLLTDISFNVRSGEILGVAGVAGNGQTELLEVLSAMRAPGSGRVTVLGKAMTVREGIDPGVMRVTGLAHIPEDRHRHGLILDFEARENAVLGYHTTSRTGDGRFLDGERIHAHCDTLMENYDIRPRNPALLEKNFSGGNQQKLVIAREMDAAPQVLVVGQPTRGVDIGAVEYIHRQLIALRDRGCAIVLVSVELDEILGLSDRIIVLNGGKSAGEVSAAQADRHLLGLMMTGMSQQSAAAVR